MQPLTSSTPTTTEKHHPMAALLVDKDSPSVSFVVPKPQPHPTVNVSGGGISNPADLTPRSRGLVMSPPAPAEDLVPMVNFLSVNDRAGPMFTSMSSMSESLAVAKQSTATASTAVSTAGLSVSATTSVSMAGNYSTQQYPLGGQMSARAPSLYDWTTTPLVTGPLYMIVNTVYVLSDCTITDHRLQVVPRDPKYPTVRIKIDNMIEFKMLNHLHYFDKYLLEIVSEGKVVKRNSSHSTSFHKARSSTGSNPSVLGSPDSASPLAGGSFPPASKSSKFSRLPNTRSGTGASERGPTKDRRGTEKPTSLGHPFHNRASVSPKGHEGGEGYSVVTLKALGGNRFFDFVEALEDVRDISQLPHDFKPIVHPSESDLRPELPVYGQKYYSLA